MCAHVCACTGRREGEKDKNFNDHLLCAWYNQCTLSILPHIFLITTLQSRHLCCTYCTYEGTKAKRLEWLTHITQWIRGRIRILIHFWYEKLFSSLYGRSYENFSINGQRVSVPSFIDYTVSVTTTQLYNCSTKSVTENT